MLEYKRFVTTFEDMRMHDAFGSEEARLKAEEFHDGDWVGYLDDEVEKLCTEIRSAYNDRLQSRVMSNLNLIVVTRHDVWLSPVTIYRNCCC